MKGKLLAIILAGIGIAQISQISPIKPYSQRNPEDYIRVGEYGVDKEGVLFSGGISSCSILCLYNKETKQGVMVHYPAYHTTVEERDKLNLTNIVNQIIGEDTNDIKSMSFRYRLNENGVRYFLKPLEELGIENTDLPMHDGVIRNVEFNLTKGTVTTEENEEKTTYNF